MKEFGIDNVIGFGIQNNNVRESGDIVTLIRQDSSLIEEIEAPAILPLDNIQVQVVDSNDNPILATSYLAYTTNQLNLNILSQQSVILAQNSTISIGQTPPPTPVNGQLWVQTF